MLLSLYREKDNLFKSITIKNKEVWDQISTGMKRHGYKFRSNECDQKFRNMKRTYNSYKDNKKKLAEEKNDFRSGSTIWMNCWVIGTTSIHQPQSNYVQQTIMMMILRQSNMFVIKKAKYDKSADDQKASQSPADAKKISLRHQKMLQGKISLKCQKLVQRKQLI